MLDMIFLCSWCFTQAAVQCVIFTEAFHPLTLHWLSIPSNGNIQTVLSVISYIFHQNLPAYLPFVFDFLGGLIFFQKKDEVGLLETSICLHFYKGFYALSF